MSTDTKLTPFPPLYTPGPVFYSPEHGGWHVPSYADAVEALRLQNAVPALAGREEPYEAYQVALPAGPMARAMWARDEPAHAALRHMTEASFRALTIAPIITTTRKLAHALLSRKIQREPAGHLNLVEEYSSPLAGEAIDNGLMGIDPAEAPWLRVWMRAWEERNTTPPAVFVQEEATFV